jgi:hypothetical protein
MARHSVIPVERIASRIFLVRAEKVMLDSDLAELYGVETGALVRAVKRNQNRFPKDFSFQLSDLEFENLRCQTGTQVNGEVAAIPRMLSPSRELPCFLVCSAATGPLT